jgi:hypothetical protein
MVFLCVVGISLGGIVVFLIFVIVDMASEKDSKVSQGVGLYGVSLSQQSYGDTRPRIRDAEVEGKADTRVSKRRGLDVEDQEPLPVPLQFRKDIVDTPQALDVEFSKWQHVKNLFVNNEEFELFVMLPVDNAQKQKLLAVMSIAKKSE